MTHKGHIVILGAAESGVGAALLAKQQAYSVFVSDSGPIALKYKELLYNHEIDFEENTHSFGKIAQAQEVIKSPGIPESAAIVQKIIAHNIPIISELEFAARYTHATLICITGSNGKTTTATLTYHILKQAGLSVALVGNVGKSLAMQVAQSDKDYYVIEVSSFQLDNMYEFKANIAVLLNITPDHLDRYDYSFQKYIESKFRILQNMKKDDCFIYCTDDDIIIKELKQRNVEAAMYSFTTTNNAQHHAYRETDNLHISAAGGATLTISTRDLLIQGRHNFANSMAAAIIAQIAHIKNDAIRESMKSFRGVEHRLELLPFTLNGIEFINDSKATNVNSTWYALESMQTPVVWIAGGTDKGNDYSELHALASKKVKALICLGVNTNKLRQSFTGIVPIIAESDSMAEAVRLAYSYANQGDTVLLSPCCASFDLFENYEDRGRKFKEEVRKL